MTTIALIGTIISTMAGYWYDSDLIIIDEPKSSFNCRMPKSTWLAPSIWRLFLNMDIKLYLFHLAMWPASQAIFQDRIDLIK
uniref:Uncharacterized protein n=1 Tax=Romanomermis culicivorax TaxID=13658 RepID=A0A915I936_ROMCU